MAARDVEIELDRAREIEQGTYLGSSLASSSSAALEVFRDHKQLYATAGRAQHRFRGPGHRTEHIHLLSEVFSSVTGITSSVVTAHQERAPTRCVGGASYVVQRSSAHVTPSVL